MSSCDEAPEPATVREPGQATREERTRYEQTHLPYRSWCMCCVMGRGRQERQGAGSRDPNIIGLQVSGA